MIQAHLKIKHFGKKKTNHEQPLVKQEVDDKFIQKLLERKGKTLCPVEECCNGDPVSERVLVTGNI